jgi:hypothetical protein
MLRRGEWDEIELVDEPEALLLIHPGWTADRETLALALRETGWFATNAEPFVAAENAELKWGWVGVTEDRTVVICDATGIAAATGAEVDDVLQVTLARMKHGA